MGLANLLANALPISLTNGISTVLETLVSQAYGIQLYAQCGHYLNKQLFIVTVAFFPISLVLWNSEAVLLALGQDATASAYAAHYLRILLPGLYLECLFQGFCIYFTAMEKSFIPMLVQLLCIPLHPVWCYLFVFKLELGMNGCAVATNFTSSLCCLLTFVFVHFFGSAEVKACWVPMSAVSLHNLSKFLTLAFSGTLLTCLEYWACEAIQVMGGILGVQVQGAMVVVYSVSMLMFYLPLSFAFAVSALVGSSLSQGNPKLAYKVIKICFAMCMSIVFVILCLLQTYQHQVVAFYTRSTRIRELAVQCLFSYMVGYVLDATQVLLQGVIKGLGIQQKAQNSAIFSFFFVGLPAAYLLAFRLGFGIEGLWYGYSMGLLTLCVMYSAILLQSDWDQVAKEIRRRLKESEEALPGVRKDAEALHRSDKVSMGSSSGFSRDHFGLHLSAQQRLKRYGAKSRQRRHSDSFIEVRRRE